MGLRMIMINMYKTTVFALLRLVYVLTRWLEKICLKYNWNAYLLAEGPCFKWVTYVWIWLFKNILLAFFWQTKPSFNKNLAKFSSGLNAIYKVEIYKSISVMNCFVSKYLSTDLSIMSRKINLSAIKLI